MARPSMNQVIIMKDGATLRGQIIDESISIDTGYGISNVPVKKISRVGFKDAYIGIDDFIETKDMEKYTGKVTNEVIRLKKFSDDFIMNIPTKKMLIILCSIL